MISQPSLAEALATSNTDRRMSTRHSCTETAVRAVIMLGGEACVTVMQDLSLGGLGVLMNAIVAPEEWLNLELRNSAGAWFYRQVRAVHVSPARSGKWFFGGEFDQPLDLEELRQLLARPQMARSKR